MNTFGLHKFKIFSFLILTIIVFSCSQTESEKRAINPNGDSELGLLMREMHEEGKKMMAAAKKGEKHTFTHDPEKILSAIATEPEKANSHEFKVFAQQYVSVMKAYKSASTEEFLQEYKGMVSICQNCHEALCPGPLRAINKLEL